MYWRVLINISLTAHRILSLAAGTELRWWSVLILAEIAGATLMCLERRVLG